MGLQGLRQLWVDWAFDGIAGHSRRLTWPTGFHGKSLRRCARSEPSCAFFGVIGNHEVFSSSCSLVCKCTMGANRKLQQEIDRTLKKVQEGIEVFDQIWDKVSTLSAGPKTGCASGTKPCTPAFSGMPVGHASGYG